MSWLKNMFTKPFGSSGSAGLLENIVTGTDYGKYLNGIDRTADTGYAAGTGTVNEGLNDLRNLDTEYQANIANGGLTPALRRQFEVARGQLQDNYTRAGRSLSAALAARRAQSGGALTPGAVAEMEKEAGAQRDEQLFDSTNNLNMGEANLGYQATRDFYSGIEKIRSEITQTGLTQQQQALLAKLQLANLRFQRNKAIADTASRFAMGMGGG